MFRVALPLFLLGGSWGCGPTRPPLTPGMGLNPANPAYVRTEDFGALAGDDWKGTLTYLDYQPPYEDVTIPAELTIALSSRSVRLAHRYPEEPKANEQSEVPVSEDGSRIDGDRVTVRRRTQSGALLLVAEGECEDMGRKATCINSYRLETRQLVIRKDVRIEGREDTFRRSEYRFVR